MWLYIAYGILAALGALLTLWLSLALMSHSAIFLLSSTSTNPHLTYVPLIFGLPLGLVFCGWCSFVIFLIIESLSSLYMFLYHRIILAFMIFTIYSPPNVLFIFMFINILYSSPFFGSIFLLIIVLSHTHSQLDTLSLLRILLLILCRFYSILVLSY